MHYKIIAVVFILSCSYEFSHILIIKTRKNAYCYMNVCLNLYSYAIISQTVEDRTSEVGPPGSVPPHVLPMRG